MQALFDQHVDDYDDIVDLLVADETAGGDDPEPDPDPAPSPTIETDPIGFPPPAPSPA